MRLKDRVAIVTGAARGIGNAAAVGLAREGARVVLNYLDYEEQAQQTIRQIEAAGGTAFAYHADVTSSAQVEGMVSETVKRYGTVDILINNAGWYPHTPWLEITEEEWDKVQAVNLKSCFLCSKAVYPYMRQQKRGRIINVSSVTFWVGHKLLTHYVAAKGGMIGFTRALAREIGPDFITVNAVTPGSTQTETDREMFSDQEAVLQEALSVQSLPRREQSEDLIGTFVFLASDDSAFITGQTINVDGGWAMH